MKRFEPTPSRLERARREGDHPLSHDAVAVGSFGGALVVLLALAPSAGSALREGLRASLASERVAALAAPLATLVTLACGASIVAAVGATLLQTRGLHFRPPPMRLAFARAFTLEAWRGTARSTLFAGAAVALIAVATAPRIEAVGATLVAVLVAGIASALADVLAVRSAWRRRLRMTHDELRRDMREHDGDPQTRGRRRRLHRSLLRGSLREVRRASFVIVNPTHVAVALRYAPPSVAVPEILVRAADARAQRVRALAAAASIPTVEDPPLARALYAHDALGPIPLETYVAVAQIVASLKRRS